MAGVTVCFQDTKELKLTSETLVSGRIELVSLSTTSWRFENDLEPLRGVRVLFIAVVRFSSHSRRLSGC